MYLKHTFTLGVVAVMLGSSQLAWGQDDLETENRRAELQELSTTLRQRAEARRKQAQETAQQYGLPLRYRSPDGTTLELQRLTPAGH